MDAGLKDLQRRLAPLTLYVVGGAVRDGLLERDSRGDDDLCGPHMPDEVAAACASAGIDAIPQAPKLGTLLLRMDGRSFEYTAFRTESYATGHRPSDVEFTRSMALDAARRDFTVNALYMDLQTGSVFDPTGIGLADLRRRVLRAVAEQTMLDDGLRILRLIRFACELGFTIDPETYRIAKNSVNKLREIAPERINAEFSRMLLCEPATRLFNMPANKRALLALYDLGALELILGERVGYESIEACACCEPETCRDAIYRVRDNTDATVLASRTQDSGSRTPYSGSRTQDWGSRTQDWGSRTQDWGSRTQDWGSRTPYMASLQHDLILRLAALLAALGPENADAALLKLRYPNAVQKTVKALLEARLGGGETPRLTLAELGRERAGLFVSLVRALCDAFADVYASELTEMERQGAPFSPNELAIDGKDICAALDIPPSPRVGEIMRGLWRMCVLEPGLNTRDRLLDELAKGD